MSGESVRIISLHGAVAGTVAPRAHTALRACNLRLKLPTLLSFINNGELFSAHCGGQHTRHLPHFLQHLQQLLRWLSTEGQCADFYFLPIQGNPIGPLVPTTVGLKFGSTYNKTTVKHLRLCLFVTNYCQLVSIGYFTRGSLTQLSCF